MPGSLTSPGRTEARLSPPLVSPSALRKTSAPGMTLLSRLNGWPARSCRRFAGVLANADARLGANADRYSFIAVDFHHLLLASLPAHTL